MPRGLKRTVPAVGFAGILALLAWSRTLSPWALLTALVVVVVAALLEARRQRASGERTLAPVALAALSLGLVAAGATTLRLERGIRDWQGVVAARQERLSSRLQDRMEGAIRRVTAAAYLAADPGWEASFDAMERIRERTEVAAVALVDPDGRPVVWAGHHRGRLPEAVLRAEPGIVYTDGTLFTYLYAVAPAGEGRRAVAAMLLQAGPPLRGKTNALSERFEAVTGERPRFGAGEDAGADWTLVLEGKPVMHARFPALTQGDWRSRVARTGREMVFVLMLTALGLFAAAWLRSVEDRGGLAGAVPLLALSMTLMAAPLRRTFGLDRLFSPGFFVLPVPGDFVIEGVIVVLLPLAALMSTLRPPGTRRSELWLRLSVGAALVGGGFAIGAGVMTASAGLPMLTSVAPLWYVLQTTTVVLLSVLAAVLMPRASRPDEPRTVGLYLVAGAALAGALSAVVALVWSPGRPVPTPLLLAWSVPFLLSARGLAGYAGRGDVLLRWLVAGWLASTAVIPHLWVASERANLEQAEAELESFGTRADPFLTYLLVRFAAELQQAESQGEQGLDLLYESWVGSGLASEPYPLEISLWELTGERRVSLPLGVRLDTDDPGAREVERVVAEAMSHGVMENIPAEGGGVSRILAVPLPGRGVVSVAVAPRANLQPTSALATFIEGEARSAVTLDLLRAQPGAASPPVTSWHRVGSAWRKEALVQEGPDTYQARLELRMPPAGIRFARAMLLVTLDLLLLTGLWTAGLLARGDLPAPPGGWTGWLAGFRARLIVSLFAFFLLPTAVFGWAAYRALAEEVTRAAREVAERAVAHAAGLLPQTGLEETASRTGEDLLFYERGSLADASMPAAVELGLYDAWMPPDLYTAMMGGEARVGTERGSLAGRSYLVAYRRLPDSSETVAVPVWLAARDVAVRQREFGHLVLFGVLIGAVLSLSLSVLVGRALARPIGELRRASSAVGRGRLRVRLPEHRRDEFGELFASFNLMTRRLRRARAQEVRTARILAWGEMARQVAHEIKNPLTPIKLSVQHIRRAYRDGRADFEPILDTSVDHILAEIERLSEIAKAFSRYGAPQEATGAMERVDVAAIARDVLTLYRAPDRAVVYRLSAEPASAVAAARASELREVIVNLLENARAAVPDGGVVEVRVEDEGDGVRLEVQDNGPGIPESQLPHIFEPHFSTRSSGTGLGLAIVRRLVEGWGGAAGAESEAGQGTTVWLTIPKTPPPPAKEDGGESHRG